MLVRCTVCREMKKNPVIAQYVLDVQKGTMGRKELANVLGVSQTTISTHFNNCDEDPSLYLDFEDTDINIMDEVQKLKGLLPRIRKRLDVWLRFPPTAPNEKAIKNLLSEARGLIKDLAQIEGVMRAPSHLRVEQMNIQFNQLQTAIFESLCPHCKDHVMEALSKTPALEVI